MEILFKTGSKLGLIAAVNVSYFNDYFVFILIESEFAESKVMKFRRSTERQNYHSSEIDAKNYLIDKLCIEFDKMNVKSTVRERVRNERELFKQIDDILNFEIK